MRDALMTVDAGAIDYSRWIPIFPLPNCVLLPRAIVPLHIFEPRYREMTRDALEAGGGVVSMALLKPGYEARYYTHVAAIHRAVCVGRIVRHERLDDGRYNLLLQGLTRATVKREDRGCSYRRGLLVPVAIDSGLNDVEAERLLERLLRILDPVTLAAVSPTGVLRNVLNCPDLSVSDKLDLLAFDLVTEPEARQRFLGQADIARRAKWLGEILARLRTCIRAGKVPGRRPPQIPSDN
jgi:Lon protease-like protein